MAKLRAVFFDVGETLIDETRLLHGWADALGVDRNEFLAVLDDVIMRDEPIRQVFERLRPGFDVAAARAQRKRDGTDFLIEVRDLYADARPSLSTLVQSGLFVGIAGNQPPTAKAALQSFGLDAHLITTSAELGVTKPSADFFRQMLELGGFRPDECAYVGDRVDNDVIPAQAAGMTAIFIERGPWGRVHTRRGDAARADIRVTELSQIAAAIAA
ncbi:HAD family hydrolase [Bradyrhizobium sp. LHD-71]|uniref:HAD family hydrolase n=1 Tax=Bradyrhizobium sp. LHD-71 TaxID=3072141 RepID=UPI00280FF609|nr:HAD family hydrolase [Bradyrhizobium sp. LHD-71]MDQ8729533.1 HAD family hydrolase [Bradyrhizobium sp. LHD-71]